MKEFLKSIIFAALLVGFFSACSDDGSSAPEEPVDTFDASVVCPENLRGTFTDTRDGQVYKYTTIGNQVWMAENLKFDAPYSVCYDKIEGFCNTFGRFYSLHLNGEFFDLFDQELLDTICPAGWHVPSVDEWKTLSGSMGGSQNDVNRLYSSFDFGDKYKPGTDDCGFNSLPAGYLLIDGNLSAEYEYSAYWTSTAKRLESSYICYFTHSDFSFGVNPPKLTIRCVRN